MRVMQRVMQLVVNWSCSFDKTDRIVTTGGQDGPGRERQGQARVRQVEDLSGLRLRRGRPVLPGRRELPGTYALFSI